MNNIVKIKSDYEYQLSKPQGFITALGLDRDIRIREHSAGIVFQLGCEVIKWWFRNNPGHLFCLLHFLCYRSRSLYGFFGVISFFIW